MAQPNRPPPCSPQHRLPPCLLPPLSGLQMLHGAAKRAASGDASLPNHYLPLGDPPFSVLSGLQMLHGAAKRVASGDASPPAVTAASRLLSRRVKRHDLLLFVCNLVNTTAVVLLPWLVISKTQVWGGVICERGVEG